MLASAVLALVPCIAVTAAATIVTTIATAPPAAAAGFSVGNGVATYDPTAAAANDFLISTIAPGAVASTISVISATSSGASADTTHGYVVYQPPVGTVGNQSVVYQACNVAGPCGPCPTPTASCGQGTISYFEPHAVTDSAQVPIVGGYSSQSAYQGNNAPAEVHPGQTYSVSGGAAPEVVPSQECSGAVCATVNWISNIVTISPVPAGETYVPGSATFSGGSANTQGIMTLTYCTAAGQSGCTAQTGTAQGNTAGSCQPNNPCGGWNTTYPYLELSTGSTQFTPGTSLTFPTMTAQFTVTGAAGSVIQPMLTEADVTANATFLISTTATAYSWPTPAQQFTSTTTIKNAQTVSITSTAPTHATVGGPTYAPMAVATSGLPTTITVDSASSAVCAITAGVVSFTSTGTCTLDADQAGDGANSAAPQSHQSFTVYPAASVPGPPTNVTAVPGTGQATVKWSAPGSNGGSAITAYVVTEYIAGVPQVAETSNSTATSKTISPLVNGTAYTFTVAAKNAVGTGPNSAASAPVTAGTASPPGFQAAIPGNGTAKVGWTTPANNGSPITGYTITPYVGSTAGPAQTFNSTNTSDIVTGLANGTAYTFAVQAVNGFGTGAAAVTAPITVGTPASPGFPNSVPGNGSAKVAWVAPASNGSPITGYTITPVIGSTPQTPVVFNTNASSDVVPGLTNGVVYTFRVVAQNAVGTGTMGVTAAITVGAPVPPGFQSASPGNASATVHYTLPAANGSPLTGYVVVPVIGSVLQPAQNFATPSATALTVTGLANGTTYTFRISAVNAIGTSPVAITAPIVVGTPTAPGFPSALAKNGSAKVSWLASNNNGSPITGYVITPMAGSTALPAQTFNSTTTSQTVTGLTNGVTYTFRVAAINGIGTGPYATAAAVKVGSPAAPTGLVGVAGPGQVTLNWVAGSDNGSPITGYVVTPYKAGVAQAPVTFLNPATSEILSGLASGSSYTFKVAAINAIGTSPLSAASAAVIPT